MADIHVSNAAITTVPAGSATVVLWDSTADSGKGTTLTKRRSFPAVRRAIVRVYMDQAATFLAYDLVVGSNTFRAINGAGTAISASTWFEADVLFTSDDHKLVIATGTVPTVWEVSVRLVVDDRALGQ